MHLAQSSGRESDQRKNPIFTLFILLPKCSHTATTGNSTLSWMVHCSSQVQPFLPSYNLKLTLPSFAFSGKLILSAPSYIRCLNKLISLWHLKSYFFLTHSDGIISFLKDKSPIENQAFLLNSSFYFFLFSPLLQTINLEEKFQWKYGTCGAPKCHGLIHLC